MFLKHSVIIYLNFVTTVFIYVNGSPVSSQTSSGCILPVYPANGKWAIIGGSDANQGSKVPFNTIISFSCNEQYILSSDYNVITCLDNDWNLPAPKCLPAEGRSNRRKRGEEIKGEVTGIGGDGGDAHAGDRDRRGEGRGDGRGAAVGGRGGDGVVLGELAGVISGKLHGKGGKGGEGRAGRPDGTGRGEGVGGRGGDGLVIGVRRRRDVEREIQPIQEDNKETHHVKRQLWGNSNGYDDAANTSGGGRGGDGIVIESGGRRTVIGPGEEGSSNYDGSGVSRGGQGGIGVIRGGITIGPGGSGGQGLIGNRGQGGSGSTGNTGGGSGGQTIYGEGQRGQDGLVIRDGETVNGFAIGIGQPGGNGQTTGGRGGDGTVVNGGRVDGVLVGIGGKGGSSGSSGSNNKKGQQGSGQGTRPGNGYTGQSGFEQDAFGQDGTYSSQNSDVTGGRGGSGVVIRGGTITGTVVGVGGQGSPGGSGGTGFYYRKKRETQGEEVGPTLQEGETQETFFKNQEDQVRLKRQLKSITTKQYVFVTVIKDGKAHTVSSSQGSHDGEWNGQGGTRIGGTGGSGVSLFNNPELEGVLIGIGGQGGTTYIKRNRRQVEEEQHDEDIERNPNIHDRIKRQATITYTPGQPILVGGRGGDGVIIDGGVVQGIVVGYGGPGGSPQPGRKRRQAPEEIQTILRHV